MFGAIDAGWRHRLEHLSGESRSHCLVLVKPRLQVDSIHNANIRPDSLLLSFFDPLFLLLCVAPHAWCRKYKRRLYRINIARSFRSIVVILSGFFFGVLTGAQFPDGQSLRYPWRRGFRLNKSVVTRQLCEVAAW